MAEEQAQATSEQAAPEQTQQGQQSQPAQQAPVENKQPTMAEQLEQSKAAHAAARAERTEGAAKDEPAEPAKPETAEAEKAALNPEKLGSTGNDVLDAGIAMMQEVAGLNSTDVDRILATAFERGDPSLIDAKYIQERFGKHAGYVEKLARQYIEHTTAQTQRIVKEVHDKVGGKAAWDELNAAFQEAAPAHLKRAVDALAKSDDYLGVAELITDYAKSSGLVTVQGNQIRAAHGAGAAALSAAGFRDELQKLRKAYPNRSLESGEVGKQYKILLDRRAAGRTQGL